MTDRIQDFKDDLAFMRDVVQAGDAGSRRRGGAIIATAGFLFAGCSLLNEAASLNLLPWPPATFAWSWFAAMALFGVVLTAILVKAPGGQSRTSRASGMAWSALGWVILTTVLSCAAAQYATGDGAVWAVLPSVIFGLYGAGWTVSAVLSGRGWERAVGIGAFVAAVAIAFLSRSPLLYLAYAAGLVLLAGLPGLAMMRERTAG